MRLTSALLISLSLLCTSFTYASSEDDYEKALTAYSQARFDEAFIHLKNSLQQDPDNLAAKILMGKLLLVNGYLQAAEAEFYEALDQGADINLVAEALGNALLFQIPEHLTSTPRVRPSPRRKLHRHCTVPES